MGCSSSSQPQPAQQPYIYHEENHYFNRKTLLKIILLGDSGVGKTSLINQFVHRSWVEDYKATIGADFLTKEIRIGENNITLQIWDTAGQERFQSLCSAFYRGADCCVLVFDVNSVSSFEHTLAGVDPRGAVENWRSNFAEQIGLTDPDSYPFLLIGNKIDLDKRAVTKERAQAWCKAKGGIPYYETSAKTSVNVDEAFRVIATKALKEPSPS